MPPNSGARVWNSERVEGVDTPEIRSILKAMGERLPPASRLILVGGGALALLGSPRPTIDIDFLGDDVNPSDLHRTIMQIAADMEIHVEPVPLERFVPLLEGSQERTIRIGQFGNLDRGFDTALDDIVFLVRRGFIDIQEFERMLQKALTQAGKFDFHPDILDHLQELKRRLN